MNLTGKLLIAMPAMGDARFAHALIVVCAHSAEGAMGVVVNKPVPDLSLGEMLTQIKVAHGPSLPPVPILFGGPVETGRGFVLHSADWMGEAGTMPVGAALGLTSTRDVLEEIGAGDGPERALLALGYAGWGAGQLEGEILANVWLTAEFDRRIVFSEPHERKWQAALKQIGVEPMTLSAQAGHA